MRAREDLEAAQTELRLQLLAAGAAAEEAAGQLRRCEAALAEAADAKEAARKLVCQLSEREAEHAAAAAAAVAAAAERESAVQAAAKEWEAQLLASTEAAGEQLRLAVEVAHVSKHNLLKVRP